MKCFAKVLTAGFSDLDHFMLERDQKENSLNFVIPRGDRATPERKINYSASAMNTS